MRDLIEALTIFQKYAERDYPTHCEHDQLTIASVERRQVSDEDHARLEVLGFHWDETQECYYSFKFGSC